MSRSFPGEAEELVVSGTGRDPICAGPPECVSAPFVPTMPAASAASWRTTLAVTTVMRAARMEQPMLVPRLATGSLTTDPSPLA